MSTQERIQLLKEAEPNSWIALSHDESSVVAKGSSYADAVQKAEESGEDDPIMVRIPEDWVPMVL